MWERRNARRKFYDGSKWWPALQVRAPQGAVLRKSRRVGAKDLFFPVADLPFTPLLALCAPCENYGEILVRLLRWAGSIACFPGRGQRRFSSLYIGRYALQLELDHL